MYRLNDTYSDIKGIIKISCAVAIFSVTGYAIHCLHQNHMNKILIKKKQNELSKKKELALKKLKDLRTPIENMEKITNMNLQKLIDSISAGEYKPIDVLYAFQAKALIKDKEFNFLTDINLNLEKDLMELEKSNKGQIRGIPVSIKESFNIAGYDSTYGMLDRTFKAAVADGVMIRILRLQGMIPFVTTNMCQTGFSIESSNPIFGETLNPHNKSRTCGGSSGGEGAILACGASILGLGSDIGGSIRIPSSYCGIFGFKPTSQRFSHRHSSKCYAKQNIINLSVGPMARRIDDLITFFQSMSCSDLYKYDPSCPPICFNEKVFNKKRPLRIGFYTHLGGNQVKPIPAVERAVEIAKSALESAGHVLLPFSIPNIDHAIFNLYLPCLFTDGGTGFLNHFIAGNPVDPSISFTVFLLKIPNFIKHIASFLIRPFNKNYSIGLNAVSGVSSVYKLWELKDLVSDYRELVLLNWENQKLDGIICPVLPITAPPLQTSSYIMDIIGYSALYNLLDYPAGSVPVTSVNQEDIDKMKTSYPRDTHTHRKIIDYQKDSVGMPVGVQCVSMLWRDETCLRIMKDLTENIN